MKNLILIALLTSQIASSDTLVFLVNIKNTASEISALEIRDYFLKRKKTWPNQVEVRFIDRTSSVPIRKLFLTDILEKSNTDLELYWIGQKLYTGESAPLKEADDELVIKFVSNFDGGIGYVSSETKITSKLVKTLEVK